MQGTKPSIGRWQRATMRRGLAVLLAIAVIATPLFGAAPASADTIDCGNPQVRQALQSARTAWETITGKPEIYPADVHALKQALRSAGYTDAQLTDPQMPDRALAEFLIPKNVEDLIGVCLREPLPPLPAPPLPVPPVVVPLPAPPVPVPAAPALPAEQVPTTTYQFPPFAWSTRIVNPLSDGGVLPVGKLGDYLVGDPTKSDAVAATAYVQGLQKTIADLQSRRAAFDATANQKAQMRSYFDAAVNQQKIAGVQAALDADTAASAEEGIRNVRAARDALAVAAVSIAFPVFGLIALSKDVGDVARDLSEAVAAKRPLTPDENEKMLTTTAAVGAEYAKQNGAAFAAKGFGAIGLVGIAIDIAGAAFEYRNGSQTASMVEGLGDKISAHRAQLLSDQRAAQKTSSVIQSQIEQAQRQLEIVRPYTGQ